MSTFEPPFYLIGRDGETHEFKEADSLLAYIRASRLKVGISHYIVRKGYYPERVYPPGLAPTLPVAEEWNDWIIRDCMGRALLPHDIAPPYVRRGWCRDREKLKEHAASLGLPIPGSGKRRWRFSSYYRYPGHISVERENEGFMADVYDDECYEYNRNVITGRVQHPPSSWDDIPRSCYSVKNWKNYRRHQWKS